MIEIKEDNSIRLESLKKFKHSSLILEGKRSKDTPWDTVIKTLT